jgi:glycine C-acetyltransferase
MDNPQQGAHSSVSCLSVGFETDQLGELKQKGTYFKLRVLEDEQAPVPSFDGKKVINLASNN